MCDVYNLSPTRFACDDIFRNLMFTTQDLARLKGFSFYPDVVIHSAMLTLGSLTYSAHGDFSRTKEIKIGTLGLLPATDRN